MQIATRTIDQIKRNPKNARTHSPRQIHQIAASIREFGFTNPILVDEGGMIIAGHGRLAAAAELKLTEIPIIEITGLSDAKRRALALADNRIALNAGWDLEILAVELQQLSTLDLDYDLDITGFDIAEIDLLIEQHQDGSDQSRDDHVPLADVEPITKPGDLWILGTHKLLCGDARDPASFAKLMGDQRARVMFADPPYNVKIDGHVCGSGSIKHRDFAMASGEMSETEFVSFLTQICKNAVALSLDGAIHFICMDWRHMSEMLAAGKVTYSELKNLCVWNKDNGGMGSFYRSQHELIFVFKVGTARHLNTVELGRSGRYRTNVWDYPGVNTMRPGRLAELAMHPTVKPVALVMDAIKDCSRRGDIVLDPFGGSGTSIVAAQKSGRHARVIEIDPGYVDVAIRRWQDFSGRDALHQTTGRKFAEMAKESPGAKVFDHHAQLRREG